MKSKSTKLVILIAAWLFSLILAVFCSACYFNHLYSGAAESNTDYDLLYNGKTYSSFVQLSEGSGFTAAITRSGTPQEERYVCKLAQGDTSLGQIMIDMESGEITSFYADSLLAQLDQENAVLVSDHQVYVDADAYRALLSGIS